ncbi:hypothetical protein BDY19DRAFT_117908 [Irpex rosettiformis]|uniref:Uncharacterized protein n=1 Tax=Irpex rosettiformis TaxID=378272 RepID=A0ACB8U618_9APHY|nr:hypothetical protein BDY19DRAFT_117908 [Irpex rosettiformis]
MRYKSALVCTCTLVLDHLVPCYSQKIERVTVLFVCSLVSVIPGRPPVYTFFLNVQHVHFRLHTAVARRAPTTSIPPTPILAFFQLALDSVPKFTRSSAAAHALPVLGELDVHRVGRTRVKTAPTTSQVARPSSTSLVPHTTASTGSSLRRPSSLGPSPAFHRSPSSLAATPIPSPPTGTPKTRPSGTAAARDIPPHLSVRKPNSSPRPMTSPLVMNHRLEFPALSDPITAPSVHNWIGGCEDAYEVFTMLTAKSVGDDARILMAGLKMEGEGAVWWNENRTTLKALASWDLFVSRVKERFVPSNWKLDALEAYYTVRQKDTEDFASFAQRLQSARNVLANAGPNFNISDAILKNHLLFYCNSRLRRRALAIPTLKYGETKVDSLIAMLSAVWASMLEEGTVRQPSLTTRPSTVPASSRLPPLPATRPVTESERQHLKTVGGCFHCGLEPSSPQWYPHTSANCKGNSDRGIAPRQPSGTTATPPSAYRQPAARVAAVLEDDADDENGTMPYLYTVGAINLLDSPLHSPAPNILDSPPRSGILFDEVPDDSDCSDFD